MRHIACCRIHVMIYFKYNISHLIKNNYQQENPLRDRQRLTARSVAALTRVSWLGGTLCPGWHLGAGYPLSLLGGMPSRTWQDQWQD